MTELQQRLLVLLKQIDQLCRENGVEYYLVGGTLIGAIRHKGFIPWDDDADVIMTRDNWEKFYTRTKGKLPEGIFLDTQYNEDQRGQTINHYIDTTGATIYRYNVPSSDKAGVIIDMLIMDPVPDNERAKREYIRGLTRNAEIATLPYQYSLRINEDTKFSLFWNLCRQFGEKRVLNYISRKAFCYREDESDLYAQRFAGCPHFWPKEIFGKPKYVPFEDTMLAVPERAEDCLCIGFDDDWMYVPRSGVTKSTHEFCVHSMSIPAEAIAADFRKHEDIDDVIKTYVKRKKLRIPQTKDRVKTILCADDFMSAKVRLDYEKKLQEEPWQKYLKERDYPALEDFFAQYIEAQCTSKLLGSSATAGWINWYRKCQPVLIDIGDGPLYAVLVLLMHKRKLAWTGKLLKARKALDRPLTKRLREMDKRYKAVKETTSAFDAGRNGLCREALDKWLSVWPDDPFLITLDLKLRMRYGLAGERLLMASQAGLELFPDDPELLDCRARALLELGEREQALDIYRQLIGTTNHGLVLLHIRERLEDMLAEAPEDRTVRGLWLDVRRAQSEEDVPELEPELEPEQTPEPAPELESEQTPEPVPEPVLEQTSESTPEQEQTPEPKTVQVPPKSAKKPSLTPIQKKRLKLLTEVARLCKANKIGYSLFGRTLLQAARKGKYVDVNGDLSIVMTPANCKKFIEAFERKKPARRYLDSMDVNPMFHRFCVRYCAEDSLDFTVGRSGCGDRFGMFVTIEILRYADKNKKRDRKELLLEQGWEASLNAQSNDPQIVRARRRVEAMCAVLGRERVAKKLFWEFLEGPKDPKKGQFYLKPYLKERVFYPSHLLRYSQTVVLGGKEFKAMRLYDQYLTQAFGAKWKTRKFPMTKASPNRIVDPNLPSQTYLDYLQRIGVDRNAFWKLWNSNRKKWLSDTDEKIARFWDVMCLCGERYRLWEKYMPMKPYLIELYKDGKVKKLAKVLNDYYVSALALSKKGLGLCFDKKIFGILEYTMITTGKAEQVKQIRKLVPKQDWKPLPAPYEIGGKGLRRATKDDIPAILTYLKRNVHDCVYMYIDIAKYGLENPNMKIWLDTDDSGVKLVVMKYHTGIGVYTDRKKWDDEGVARLIREENVLSVTARGNLAQRLQELCADQYDLHMGWVLRFTKYRDFGIDELIETAGPEDALEIAKLISIDEGVGGHYEVQDLADQLVERMNTNMGRSYVIRQDGRIVAHIASFAEHAGVAVTSGLIVDPAYRSGVYGAALESYLTKRLMEDGFKVFSFIQNKLRLKFHEVMGNECKGEYGKMVRKKEEPEGAERGQ